jgi:1,4-dihydroxy-2-naphthoate octaprenyltransferase
MATKKQQAIGWIKAIRPKFLVSYVVLGIGGIVIGIHHPGNTINIVILILSFITIITAGIGVHYRDEAADWLAGYDLESGGVGVIRDGILKVKPLQIVGRILTVIALGFAVLQVFLTWLIFLTWQLIFIFIPLIPVIVFSNYVSERIILGHEASPAFAYSMALLWVFLAQGWSFTISTLYFVIFAFLFVFALVPYQDVGDYEVDLKTGKKTLTVKLGIDAVGQLCIIIAVISIILLLIHY